MLSQPKRAALLVYLAVANPGGFHRRDTLLALFWPELDQQRARAALRQVLSFLRRELGEDLIWKRGAEEVGIDPDRFWCDAVAFNDALQGGDLEHSLELYRGDFLPGFHISGCAEFEQWLEQRRSGLRDQAADSAARLVDRSETTGTPVEAVRWADRCVGLQPDNERAVQRLLVLLDRIGDRAGALREYNAFAQRLAARHEARPAAETRKLMEQIRERNEPQVTPIAVLPFANATGDPSNDYLADGFTEQLIADLARQPSLSVVVRGSVVKFQALGGTPRTAARELGVRYAVEGSVQLTGDQIEVAMRLVDAMTASQCWADRIRAPSNRVFAAQQDLACAVVQALGLAGAARQAQRDIPPIPNQRAYDCYLRARSLMWRFEWDELRNAIELLQRGLELVGENALLYATLGRAYLTLVYSGATADPRYLELAAECGRKGFALDPRCAPLQVLRGSLCKMTGTPLEALPFLRSALDLDPKEADAACLLGYLYALTGRQAEAKPLIDTLLRIDPLSGATHALAGLVEAVDGRFNESIPRYRRACTIELNPGGMVALGAMLARSERRNEARETLEQATAAAVSNLALRQLAFFYLHALSGDKESALRSATSELLEAAQHVDFLSWEVTCCYALIGPVTEGLRWLENTARLGFINYPFLAALDPHLTNLRKEPQFFELMERVRRQWEDFRA